MLEHVKRYLITLLWKSEQIATAFAHVLLGTRALCLVISEHQSTLSELLVVFEAEYLPGSLHKLAVRWYAAQVIKLTYTNRVRSNDAVDLIFFVDRKSRLRDCINSSPRRHRNLRFLPQ